MVSRPVWKKSETRETRRALGTELGREENRDWELLDDIEQFGNYRIISNIFGNHG